MGNRNKFKFNEFIVVVVILIEVIWPLKKIVPCVSLLVIDIIYNICHLAKEKSGYTVPGIVSILFAGVSAYLFFANNGLYMFSLAALYNANRVNHALEVFKKL